MTPNPYIEFNERQEGDIAVTPTWPRPNQFNMQLSDEALDRLLKLALQFVGREDKRGIQLLLEQIGSYALYLKRPENEIDPESNVTTEQCRESGFEDGLNGNGILFLNMFGKQLANVFQVAYMRGYFEGNWTRNKDKKP